MYLLEDLLHLLIVKVSIEVDSILENYKFWIFWIKMLIISVVLSYVLKDITRYLIDIVLELVHKLQKTSVIRMENILDIDLEKYVKEDKYRKDTTRYIVILCLKHLKKDLYDWYKYTVKPTLRMCVRTEISKIKYGITEEARQEAIKVRMKMRTRKEKKEGRFQSRQEIEKLVNRMYKRRIWRRLERLKKQLDELIKRRKKNELC